MRAMDLLVDPLGGSVFRRQTPALTESAFVASSDLGFDDAPRIGRELTAAQRRIVEDLLVEYKDVFATKQHPYGQTDMVVHRMDTGDHPPIHRGLRPMSPAQKEVVRDQVKSMLEQGAIRPSKSPWASAVTLAPKKDGTWRFCLDYRAVNDITKKDRHPLPRISDLLEALSGAKYFTTLDLAAGYWQIPMAEEDIEKTAFITAEGSYEFLRMPFGLCNAPATFQRWVNTVFAPMLRLSVLCYIDDILVFSKTFEEHVVHVREVLERLRQAKALAKVKKCDFFQRAVDYVGHTVSWKGIAPQASKTAKIREWPVPRNKSELLSFLGLVGY